MSGARSLQPRLPRRIGMTRNGNPFAPLHPDAGLRATKAPPASAPTKELTDAQINASPEHSSDEHSNHNVESDDDFGDVEQPRKRQKIQADAQSDESRNRATASSPLPVAPSNIKPTTFATTRQEPLKAVTQPAAQIASGHDEDQDIEDVDAQQLRKMNRPLKKFQNTHLRIPNIHTAASRRTEKENKPPGFRQPTGPVETGRTIKSRRTTKNSGFRSSQASNGSPQRKTPPSHQSEPPRSSASSNNTSPSAFKKPPNSGLDLKNSTIKGPTKAFLKPPSPTKSLSGDTASADSCLLTQASDTVFSDAENSDQASVSSLSDAPDDPMLPGFKPCPMCRNPVEISFIEDRLPVTRRPTVRQQALFCKAHRQRDAMRTWIKNGYPDSKDLNWQSFDVRLRRHHPELKAILRSDRPSFYRDALAKHVATGYNRTLQQRLARGGNVEGLSSGYYGSRGTKLITQNILHAFSSILRSLATTDELIAASGVAGYVQAVLAPEMAVLLVREDMGVGEERAREVLKESEAIGNLVNEEEDEVVVGGDEEEAAD